MKKLLKGTGVACAVVLMLVGQAWSADIELARKSTLEQVLKAGEIRVGFEAGYMPFEMTDKNGNFVGFDIDIAKEMAKAMGSSSFPSTPPGTASFLLSSPESSTSS